MWSEVLYLRVIDWRGDGGPADHLASPTGSSSWSQALPPFSLSDSPEALDMLGVVSRLVSWLVSELKCASTSSFCTDLDMAWVD